VHDHYFHAKQLCWKKNQPLYLMQMDPKSFDAESLRVLNLESTEDLAYVVVNEDGLKLPFNKDELDMGIVAKFLANPTKIDTIDDLYDFLHLNKGLPVKYIFTMVNHQKGRPVLSTQATLVRKFFYENSQPIEDLVMFGEVTNRRIAEKIGLTGDDQIVLVQNENEFSTLPGKQSFQIMNLKLERTFPFKEFFADEESKFNERFSKLPTE
jgi:hypothetical protein